MGLVAMGVGYCWLLCAPLRGIRFVAPRNIDMIRTEKLKKWCILVHFGAWLPAKPSKGA